MREVILSEKPLIRAYLGDCMEFMADKKADEYDLAIVDPPYGIGAGSKKFSIRGNYKDYHKSRDWDVEIPPKEYWAKLFKITDNQIVWGANYMVEFIPASMGWIFWDKMNGGFSLSDGELAFTSFNKALRTYRKSVNSERDRYHPTQKPVALYRWLLKNYAECKQCHGEFISYEDVAGDGGLREMQICPECDGQKARILDTHGGSFSSAIACYMEGFDLDIVELDEDYFNEAVKRFKLNTVQENLF